MVSTTLEMKVYYATCVPMYCRHHLPRPMHCIDSSIQLFFPFQSFRFKNHHFPELSETRTMSISFFSMMGISLVFKSLFSVDVSSIMLELVSLF